MLDNIMDALKFAFRQKESVYRVGRIFKSAFEGGFNLKKVFAAILAFAEMFSCVIFDAPLTPAGQELDLTGYKLVFSDEFEGDALNTDNWSYISWDSRGGYNNKSQIQVKDGNVVFTGEYREDGAKGPGWYGGDLVLNTKYKRGYFECRCICNDGGDFWSAFWIQADHPYDHDISKGGVGGAELDIFEAMSAEKGTLKRNGVTQTIHCNGYDDDAENLDSRCIGNFKGNDIYNEYNTYGLEWTEDEYIFYVNGVETGRSSFAAGVSEVEESVRLSLCIPDEFRQSRDYKAYFTVDYVKIWQK